MLIRNRAGLAIRRGGLNLLVYMLIILVISVLFLGKSYLDENFFNSSNTRKKPGKLHDELKFTTRASSTNKTILLWTTFYGNSDFWELLFHDTVSGGCPVSGCVLAQDRQLLPFADAVLFHLLDIQLDRLPRQRPAGQLWVLFCLESPAYPLVRQHSLARLNGLFNWTMTYRWDSDVPVPYGLVLPRRDRLSQAVRAVLPRRPELARCRPPRHKRRLLAWMVSNCQTPGQRELYVAELQKYIQASTNHG